MQIKRIIINTRRVKSQRGTRLDGVAVAGVGAVEVAGNWRVKVGDVVAGVGGREGNTGAEEILVVGAGSFVGGVGGVGAGGDGGAAGSESCGCGVDG